MAGLYIFIAHIENGQVDVTSFFGNPPYRIKISIAVFVEHPTERVDVRNTSAGHKVVSKDSPLQYWKVYIKTT